MVFRLFQWNVELNIRGVNMLILSFIILFIFNFISFFCLVCCFVWKIDPGKCIVCVCVITACNKKSLVLHPVCNWKKIRKTPQTKTGDDICYIGFVYKQNEVIEIKWPLRLEGKICGSNKFSQQFKWQHTSTFLIF